MNLLRKELPDCSEVREEGQALGLPECTLGTMSRPSQAQHCLCLALKALERGRGRECGGCMTDVIFRAVQPLHLTQTWRVLSPPHQPQFPHNTEKAPRTRCLKKQNQAEPFRVHTLEYRSCLVKALIQLSHTKSLAPRYSPSKKSLQSLLPCFLSPQSYHLQGWCLMVVCQKLYRCPSGIHP